MHKTHVRLVASWCACGMPPHRGVSSLYTMVSFGRIVGDGVCGFWCASQNLVEGYYVVIVSMRKYCIVQKVAIVLIFLNSLNLVGKRILSNQKNMSTFNRLNEEHIFTVI